MNDSVFGVSPWFQIWTFLQSRKSKIKKRKFQGTSRETQLFRSVARTSADRGDVHVTSSDFDVGLHFSCVFRTSDLPLNVKCSWESESPLTFLRDRTAVVVNTLTHVDKLGADRFFSLGIGVLFREGFKRGHSVTIRCRARAILDDVDASFTIGSEYCDCRDSRRFASHIPLTLSTAYPDINSAAVHSSSVVGVHAWKPLTGGRRFLTGQNTLQLYYECGVD